VEAEVRQREHDRVSGMILGCRKGHPGSVMSGCLRSAGLLPYRLSSDLEVLVAHPGGPYFARRDNGWWSIVKGIVEKGELDEETAAREFEEETGWPPPPLPWLSLGEVTLKSRKVVVAWAVETDFDVTTLQPGMFTMGGHRYPEIDRVEWMGTDLARVKLNPALGPLVDRLEQHLGK
jgi:predicted NUDIX family NTP pyrophosphohydrolase